MLILSPSQIETFRDCPRKWGWHYLDKKPRVQHPSAQVGTVVHTYLEKYLRDGVAPDRFESLTLRQPKSGKEHTYYPGRIAHSMIPHLPPAGSCKEARIEEHFKLEYEGIQFQGYKDLVLGPTVYDHKTTADLSYALRLNPPTHRPKGAKYLEEHPQPNIYILDEYIRGTGDGSGQWTYGQTKGKFRAKKVSFSWPLDQVLDQMGTHVLPIAKQIIDAYTSRPPVKDLAYNASACDDYGGCPYKGDCKLSGKERLKGMMATSREELLAKLRAKKGPAPAAEEKAPEKETAAISPALAKLKAKQAARATGINPPAPEPKSEPESVPSKASEPEKVPVNETPARKTFDLFVDCEPVGKEVVRLETLLGPVAAEVCSDLEVPHYRLVEFGKGAGCLSAQLRASLTETPLPVGTALLMSLRTNEGRDVYQTLFELARTVTVGR